jgi:hypothetical protein
MPVRPPGAAGAARRPAGHDMTVTTLLPQRQQPHDHVVSPGLGARPSPSCPIPAAPPASAVHAGQGSLASARFSTPPWPFAQSPGEPQPPEGATGATLIG